MPDADRMKAIRDRESVRPWMMLDAFGAPPFADAFVQRFRESLQLLAEDWRSTADLYAEAKLKGAQTAYIVPLRHAAGELDKLIKTLETPRPTGAPGANPLQGDRPPKPCAAADLKHGHGAHPWVCGPGKTEAWCTGYIEGTATVESLEALVAASLPAPAEVDAFVASAVERYPDATGAEAVNAALRESAARHSGDLAALVGDALAIAVGTTTEEIEAYRKREESGTDAFSVALQNPAYASTTVDPEAFPGQVSGAEVEQYLAGVTNDLPAADPRGKTIRPEVPEHDLGVFGIDESTEAARTVMDARETGATMPEVVIPPTPMLGQPGDMGSGYSHTYIPPGGIPATFVELLTPIPAAILPPHLSHSQIETVGDCPVKYRLQRLDRVHSGPDGAGRAAPVTQIPQWAQIGGGAFHAVVEMLEHRWAQNPAAASPREDEHAMLWRSYFEAACAEIEASSPVPRSVWRSSKQGAEGETWWNVNGPLMIGRYLAARSPNEAVANLPALPGAFHSDGRAVLFEPAIEFERTVQVPTPYGLLPYKAVLDRVHIAQQAPGSNWQTFVIDDYKTGDKMPHTTSQLGEYANALRLMGVPETVKIMGRFFNARKGTWTEPVDLLAIWTPEWFAYLVTTGEANRRSLTTGPTPARVSTFCGGCSVRWACPAVGAR